MSYPYTTVNIVADSITEAGHRITTFVLTYPRYIHAEFMTHRMFSRNAQSTRAIPTHKRIQQVRENPVRPIRWGRNQKGMVAKNEEVEYPLACEAAWSMAAHKSAFAAEKLTEQGLHKQWAGRVLEPFDTITVICTATDYENFFALRCAPDAQPEINDLAWKMADAYYNTSPRLLPYDMWHLPFIEGERHTLINDYATKIGREWGNSISDIQLKVSAACCARVSYLNHDGSAPDIEKDIALHDMLVDSGHMTPLEHQAQAVNPASVRYIQYGNFHGWKQYRKTVLGEVRRFDYQAACVRRLHGETPL